MMPPREEIDLMIEALRAMELSPCNNAAAMLNQIAQNLGEYEPYLYVYEYEGLGPGVVHREFHPIKWNGQEPFASIPLYTSPRPAYEDVRDAIRYRWLRNVAWRLPAGSPDAPAVALFNQTGRDIATLDDEFLDAAMDEAMRKGEAYEHR
ncbi:hypothetical protein [Dyella caseinilytica]|uniref:GAF domain-containing protein n=1 Tax=Dyella caseinilytica TaxID=1849581 RepID=A0ABX7GXJ1_9GAMM|nr:hypothetical protein [Dyella caseinilytica]QRN55207.1 hypothetical protein ISN74_07725 [Dyella caseinilytica]GGA00128.1 hypothetical protein GCM10011408_21190 [Dyella caseinilytica]